ncbi:periplasmic binding s and sugar binding domain of LacI family protein, partial [Vibrio parahaemolyticus AQ3810]
GL